MVTTTTVVAGGTQTGVGVTAPRLPRSPWSWWRRRHLPAPHSQSLLEWMRLRKRLTALLRLLVPLRWPLVGWQQQQQQQQQQQLKARHRRRRQHRSSCVFLGGGRRGPRSDQPVKTPCPVADGCPSMRCTIAPPCRLATSTAVRQSQRPGAPQRGVKHLRGEDMQMQWRGGRNTRSEREAECQNDRMTK